MEHKPLKCLAHSFGAVREINISGAKDETSVDGPSSTCQPDGTSTLMTGTVVYRKD